MKAMSYQKFLFFLIFLLFLLSMNIWIGWDGRSSYLLLGLSALIVLTLFIDDTRHLKLSWGHFIPLFFLLLAYTYVNTITFLTIFCYFIPYTIIILLREHEQVMCIRYISKWFAILMLPCIFTYFLVQFEYVPSLGHLWVNHDPSYPVSYIYRTNYIFYVYSDYYNLRFNGPFIEAGHLGMMSAFLLMANGYDLKKKENIILLVTLLLTLSLAGYTLACIGYLFVCYIHGRVRLRWVLMLVAFISLIYFGGYYYNGGDNILNNMILSRLESDEEKGFSGNNRVGNEVMLYFYYMFSNQKLLLFGYGKEMYDWLLSQGHGGTGVYMWTVQYGVVGTIAAMMFYLSYVLANKQKTISV